MHYARYCTSLVRDCTCCTSALVSHHEIIKNTRYDNLISSKNSFKNINRSSLENMAPRARYLHIHKQQRWRSLDQVSCPQSSGTGLTHWNSPGPRSYSLMGLGGWGEQLPRTEHRWSHLHQSCKRPQKDPPRVSALWASGREDYSSLYELQLCRLLGPFYG